MNKVGFYRYGKHHKLRQSQCVTVLIGNRGFRITVDCEHILSKLQGGFAGIWIVNSSRKQIIELMHQKSKDAMR